MTTLHTVCSSDVPWNRRRSRHWGPWRLDQGRYVLAHSEHGYEIDLELCTNSAEVLDWICQIASKTWGTPECVSGLVAAFVDLLDPQVHLCSWGQSRELTQRKIRDLVDGGS